MQNTMRAHSAGEKLDVFGVAVTSEGTSFIARPLFLSKGHFHENIRMFF